MEIDEQLHARIRRLCAEGDTLAEGKHYPEALDTYWEAFDLLSAPQTQWEAATWILAAIGNANFLDRDFVAGRDNLSVAIGCPHAIGNPFLHLRLGQCQFELGDMARAADELTRAYMGGGEEVFRGDDPKYFAFIKTQIREPAGGW